MANLLGAESDKIVFTGHGAAARKPMPSRLRARGFRPFPLGILQWTIGGITRVIQRRRRGACHSFG
jgi:hypothetical protein